MNILFAWALSGGDRTFVFVLHEDAIYFLDTDGIVVRDVTRNRHGSPVAARDIALVRTGSTERMGAQLNWVRAVQVNDRVRNTLAGINECFGGNESRWLNVWGSQLVDDIGALGMVLR